MAEATAGGDAGQLAERQVSSNSQTPLDVSRISTWRSETDNKKWERLKGVRHVMGVAKKQREQQSDEFIATVSHIRRHGISAVALLSLFSEDLFDVFQRAWRAEAGSMRCVTPTDFHQLLRGFFQSCGVNYFDRNGMFLNRGGESSRTRPGGLSDLDNYAKELFVAVDARRLGMVSWDDFVSFIIDGVAHDGPGSRRVGGGGSAAAAASTGNVTSTHGRGGYPEMTYTLSKQVFETPQKKASPVAWLRYYRPWHRVAAIAKRRFFLADLTDLDIHDKPKWIRTFESDVDLLSAAFSQTWKAVVLASSDFRVRTWDPINNQVVNEFSLAHSATALYCTNNGKLYVGDRQGSFAAYDFDKCMKDNSLSSPPIVSSLPDLHENTITDILVVDDDVITVGLDSKMHCIRPHKGYQAVAYEHANQNAHKHGIFTVAHADSYHFLITTGIEPYALIWVDNMPSIPSFKLSDPNSPHASPLVGASVIHGTPNVITADVSGVTKVFDIRTCRILESFNIKSQLSKHDLQLYSVAHTGNRTRQLLFGSTSVFVFEHESRTSDIPKMAHSPGQPLLGACFMAVERVFLTWTSKEIRMWSQYTGKLEKTITSLSTAGISVLVPDDRSPGRIIIGHKDGAVTVHELASLKLLRTYRKHTTPITHIVIGVHTGLLFTTAGDGNLLVWMDLDHPLLLRGTMNKTNQFATFENQVLQDPSAQESVFFRKKQQKKRESERTGTVLAAVDILKGKVAMRVMDEKFKANVAKRKSERESVGPGHSKVMMMRPKANAQAQRNIVIEPMMKLNIHYEIVKMAISEGGQWLLLVFPSRLANVYDIEFNEAVGRYTLVIHAKLGHSEDTELVGGRFISRNDFVLTNDISGIVHVWDVESYATPVCITRFYASYPPKPVSTCGPLSEFVYEGTPDCPTLIRTKDTVKELLNSLKSPTEFQGEDKKSHSVPTISAITYIGNFLYIADELGVISCWDLSSVINICEMPNIRRAYEQFAATGQSPEGFMDMNIPSVVCTWTAHPEGICEMTTVKGQRADDGSQMLGLLTCGMDTKVGCWAMDGTEMGWLRQGPNIKCEWSLSAETALNGTKRVRTLYWWKKLKAAVLDGRARGLLGSTGNSAPTSPSEQSRSQNAWQRWRDLLNLLKQASARCVVEAGEMVKQPTQVVVETRAKRELSPRHKVLAPVVSKKPGTGKCKATTQAFKDIRQAVLDEELRKEEEQKSTNAQKQSKQQMEAILKGEAVVRDRRDDISRELAMEHNGVLSVASSPAATPQHKPKAMKPTQLYRSVAHQRPPTVAAMGVSSPSNIGIGHVGEGRDVFRLSVPRNCLPTLQSRPQRGTPDSLMNTTAAARMGGSTPGGGGGGLNDTVGSDAGFRVGSLLNTDAQVGHWSPVKRYVSPTFTPTIAGGAVSPVRFRPPATVAKVLPLMGSPPEPRLGSPGGGVAGVVGERSMTAPVKENTKLLSTTLASSGTLTPYHMIASAKVRKCSV